MAEVWYQGIVAIKGRGWLSNHERGISNAAIGGSNDTRDTAPGIVPGTTLRPMDPQVGLGTTSVPAVSTLVILIFFQLILRI